MATRKAPVEKAPAKTAPAKRAPAKRAPAKTATPWGSATVVEEVRLPQRAGEKRFSSVFQLLESSRGEALVRVSYVTDGVGRRGPVTLRPGDIARLHAALSDRSALASALGLPTVPGPPGGEA